MFVLTAALSGLLAFVVGAGALGKVTKMKTQVDNATKLQIPWQHYRLIAAPEAAAAFGLLLGLAVAPLGVAAAAGVVVLMACAFAYRKRAHDALPFLIGDAAILTIAAITAVLRIVTA